MFKVSIIGVLVLMLVGCPHKRKEMAEEIGGAPKRQLQKVDEDLQRATDTATNKIDKAMNELE